MALVDARCGAIVLLARWKAHRVTNASEMWQRCDELRCSRVAALRVLVAVKLLFWAVAFGMRQFGRPRRGKGSSRQLVCSFPLFTAHLTVTRPRSRQLVCFLNCSRQLVCSVAVNSEPKTPREPKRDAYVGSFPPGFPVSGGLLDLSPCCSTHQGLTTAAPQQDWG